MDIETVLVANNMALYFAEELSLEQLYELQAKGFEVVVGNGHVQSIVRK